MKPLTVVVPHSPEPPFERALSTLAESPLIEEIVVVSEKPIDFKMAACRLLVAGPITSRETLKPILEGITTKYFLLLLGIHHIFMESEALEIMLAKAEATKAGLIYSDFYEISEQGKIVHPLNDYQPGSVRDDFDFGAVMLFSVPAIRNALETYGGIPSVTFAGLYDLRLKLSIDHSLYHSREPLYSVIKTTKASSSETLFAYVDPRNETVQKEMEAVFTDYLKQIGAYLPPHRLRAVEQTADSFPVEVSVVIPVRNREGTVAEAVKSALSQETDFPFNVIVVDNHSTDGTTAVLSDLAKHYSSLNHIIPMRTDLGIGGCWNEALRNDACGRYAVQLDSDDFYGSAQALQKIVDLFRRGNYAMVVGSYTLVDSSLKEIPPGLIDHREWTDENGRNNALRINGLGAPRAFNAGIMRNIGFLNVSYGEDYAAVLRISREYRIGRIYDSLYLCRRWSGNTDAALSIEETNRNNAFKDEVRSMEILARQQMNRNRKTGSRGRGHGSRKT